MRFLATLSVMALVCGMALGARTNVDVKAFGAKGNGTDDDTAAIQAAIDAAGPGGKVVSPPGRYRISAAIHPQTDQYIAIERLRAQGQPYRGLFIGAGTQQPAIRECSSSIVIDVMPYRELAPYYRANDIDVWTGNESIPQLDAACGLPLIISDLMGYFDPHALG
jgi:hypothetical protein